MNTDCPSQLLALDSNAERFWLKLLKKASITVDKERGEIVADQRGAILEGIGLPDLLFRLECQRSRENGHQDELAHARIWFHVAEACAPGDSIPDLTGDNKFLLNPWIVTPSLKFVNVRLALLQQETVLESEAPKKRQKSAARAKGLVWNSILRKDTHAGRQQAI
jgi:hypothetical protein